MKKRTRSRSRSTSKRRTSRRKNFRRNPPFALNPKRRKARRKGRRGGNRRFRSNPARARSFGGGIFAGFKELISKDTLYMAGGALGSAMAGHYVMTKAIEMTNENRAKSGGGTGLPWYANGYARAGVKIAVAGLLAFPARKFNPQAAKGVLIGGIIAAIPEALLELMPPKDAASAENYNRIAGSFCPNPSALGDSPMLDLAAPVDLAGAEEVLTGLSESNPFN